MGLDTVNFPVPVVSVVPHKEVMCLLRNVISHSTEETVCDILISRDSIFFSKEGVGSWVGLEYMAQAVAAHAGMCSFKDGSPPRIGFLLGSRKVYLEVPYFECGSTLHIKVQPIWGEGELFSFRCVIQKQGEPTLLARAELNVFRPTHLPLEDNP
jgi:predicted hotdog family 3-hydroxylacyl-ACP dehydratase